MSCRCCWMPARRPGAGPISAGRCRASPRSCAPGSGWTTRCPGWICCCPAWAGACRCRPGARPSAARSRSPPAGGDLAGDKRTAADLGAWLVSSKTSPATGLQAAEGSHLGSPRSDPGGARDRRERPTAVGGGTGRGQARAPAAADLSHPSPPARESAQGVHRTRLRRPARRRPPAARRADRAVWDNLSTHTSTAMAALIAARPWLTVYLLSPYAHELNPVESVWAHLKRSLANLTKHTIAELTVLVKTRLKRMQYRPALLAVFLASTGLEYGPFL